jgi:hypothetical protein
MKLRLLIAICVLLVSVSVWAGEENKPKTLEAINAEETSKNVIKALEDAMNLIGRASEERYTDCLKAIGDKEFCECIKSKSPSVISFVEYVTITVNTKEELGYSSLDEFNKKLIDNTLKTREFCVGTLK